MNCQSVYSDVVKKEAEVFKEQFKDFMVIILLIAYFTLIWRANKKKKNEIFDSYLRLSG